jgi:hypothetical protein
MDDLKTIAADTHAIVVKGDLAAAEKRITDFGSAWDDQETALRRKSAEDWGRVDDAAYGAMKFLRVASPDAATAKAALATLLATLTDPAGEGATGSGPQTVSGIAVTDASGHAIPCKGMIKAIKRCNADDDTHADAFSAPALAALAAKQEPDMSPPQPIPPPIPPPLALPNPPRTACPRSPGDFGSSSFWPSRWAKTPPISCL